MLKLLVLLICIIFSFSTLLIFVKADSRNTPAFIDTTTINKLKVIKCSSDKICDRESQTVEVTVHATDADGDRLLYHYEATSGKIETQGKAAAIWDLSTALPGIHVVTIYADDGCGLCGKPAKVKIEVVECAECQDEPPYVVCPKEVKTAPSATRIEAGEIVNFTAEIEGGTQEKLNYGWSVSTGVEIIGATDKLAATVKALPNFAGKFIVVFHVGLDDLSCDNTSSWTIEVMR